MSSDQVYEENILQWVSDPDKLGKMVVINSGKVIGFFDVNTEAGRKACYDVCVEVFEDMMTAADLLVSRIPRP